MFYVPEFNGSLMHYVVLALLASGPLLFLAEATGFNNLGYSKFANRERGFTLPSRVGMLMIYLPAVVLVWLPLLLRGVELSTWHILVASLVSLHFGKRCLETLFLHRYSGVMHIDSVAIICGLYSTLAAVLGEVAATEVGPGGMPIPTFDAWVVIGLALWALGTGINFQHHRLLANLRNPGERDYKLPRGGLFAWVACPHYLGELIAWFGFALVYRHIAALMLTLVMVMYLAGRSHNTVKWYREKLGDQVPANWKRLVPFVY